MTRRRVIQLPSPTMTAGASWSALKRKRRTLWHHAARNHVVAGVGMACLEQDRQALREMGIPAGRKKGVWTHRVVILVENTEHAQTLGAMLPRWEVLDAVPTLEPTEAPEEEGTPLTSGSLVTWMHAVRRDVTVDYLIRATGGRGRMGLDHGNDWLEQPRRP